MDGPNSNSNTTDSELIERRLKKKKITISRLKRKIFKHVWATRIGIIAAFFVGIYLILALVGVLLSSFGLKNYIRLVSDFVFTPQEKIKSTDGRTNIAILGKAGGEHPGADLTDTMIFASVSHTGDDLVLISLPRDIWIPELRAKLNSAYFWGNQKQEGGGIKLAKSTMEEIVGQPIHYGVVGDFMAFKDVIDALGGIDIDIENSFVDPKYPVVGRENEDCGNTDTEFECRYTAVRFEKGLTHMDGATALIFVRSRNAEGDEGTDIAREARQQKVISSLTKKILSLETLLDFKKLSKVWEIVTLSIETDIDAASGAILARRFWEARGEMVSFLIPEDLLVNPPISSRYDNLYVFIPTDGTWEKVHKWVKEKL